MHSILSWQSTNSPRLLSTFQYSLTAGATRCSWECPWPIFEYSGTTHAVSEVISWKGFARSAERHLKKFSGFTKELEAFLDTHKVVSTPSGGRFPIHVLDGVWIADNHAIWYLLSHVVGSSVRDWAKRGSYPYLWPRTFYLGELFCTAQAQNELCKFYMDLHEAHIQSQRRAKKMAPEEETFPAMKSRAEAYATAVAGQKFERAPLIAQGDPRRLNSPLLKMRLVPPALHAVMAHVTSALRFAYVFSWKEKAFLQAQEEQFLQAIKKDNKPKAAYKARKIANLLGTKLAKFLFSLERADPRRPYWAAFQLLALFMRRLWDGQPYQPRVNFTTLTYSLFTLLLIDLSQRIERKSSLESVHWAHMFAFSELEYKFKMIWQHYIEERFEASFTKNRETREASRQPSSIKQTRLKAGLEKVRKKLKLDQPKGNRAGWRARTTIFQFYPPGCTHSDHYLTI